MLLENTTTNERRWVTIECDEPDATRFEFDESSPIAEAILGRCVSDLIDVPGRTVQPQQERVLEIQTKFVRLFQDISRQFQNRFPGRSMQQMSLGSGENLDPAPLIKTLEDRREYVGKAIESIGMSKYAHFTCSLHGLVLTSGS